jgi:enoyl-CoA hydratase
MTDLVRYTREGDIGVVTLDRLPCNLIDMPFIERLLASFDSAGADGACRAVVLESASAEVFSAGLDLKGAMQWSAEQLRAVLHRLYLDLMEVQAGLGKPTIAAPGGIVRGGGITLCIQCDVIVADAAVDFAYSEIDAGLIPAIHFSHLPRLAGRHLAFAPLFTGRPFGAVTAHRLGLADRIAPAGTAGKAARDLAGEFAAKPPTTMKLGRDAFHRVNDHGHRAAVETLIEAFIEARFGPDGKEGLAAFAEKRKPAWRQP